MTESVPKKWDTGGGSFFSGQSYIVSGCFPEEMALCYYGFSKTLGVAEFFPNKVT